MPLNDSPQDRLDAVRHLLTRHGQEHLLAFYDSLDTGQQASLLEQILAIDFEKLGILIEEHVRQAREYDLPTNLEPAPYYPRESYGAYDASEFRKIGEDCIRSAKVAAFTVAGGQGTRLGWNGPKGTYPATVVTGKPIFRCLAEQILASELKYGVEIPWYIMTSPQNDSQTREFFQDNNCFGLVRSNIFMFPQGVMPCLDANTGKLLLAGHHEIAVNPDGHGGSLRALFTSGAIEDMRAREIEHISYFQIDNPLVKAIDPLFIGLHIGAPDSSGQISSKMVVKSDPEEKVGVFCRDGGAGGKTRVIEYTDLPPELTHQRDEDGNLRFNAGSIAIHLLGVGFVEKINSDQDRFGLPWHRALKVVPHVEIDTGKIVEPSEANAVKLETFVFDAIPLAEKSIVYETGRVEEFAPIKNLKGIDSPVTSHQIQSDRNGSWLESHGVKVPRDDQGHVQARIEISPLTALEPADLATIDLPKEIKIGNNINL